MTDEKIDALLQAEKTPLYVFDMKELRQRVLYLKENLPAQVEICYAVKANTFIVKEISKLVDQLEICSPGEYQVCESLGLAHSQYVISGVNKEPSFIESAVVEQEPIGYFTAESVNQFLLLHRTAKKAGRRISVLLRLTSGNQFGLDKQELIKLVETYKEDPWIDICGIQFYSGTQKTSLKKLRREITFVDQLIAELYETFAFRVRKLEFGPGHPVSYFEGEQFDETEYLKEFSDMLNNMQYDGVITLELGRGLAASCGTYLTKVVDAKQNNAEWYAIVDGGIHQLVYYGQSMAMKHPKIRLFPSRKDSETKDWNICGSLCTVNDFLVKRFPLSNLQIGDVLVFEKTGAYSATEGISLFLTRELPGIVLMDEAGAFKTVRKQTQTAIFNTPQMIEVKGD